MDFDIVIVTYNSARWLPPCVEALARCDFALSRLNLVFVDNASSDETLAALEKLQDRHTEFGGFQILPQGHNGGFSTGCNTGAKAGGAPIILFLNADTEILPDALSELERAAAEAPDSVAGFELRQLPFETGHHLNPVTLETPWASGAAFAVRRAAFEQARGFDEHLFMYCEDVDLSWRLRALGHTLRYLPGAAVVHHSYEAAQNGGAAMKLGEYAGGLYGNLLLRYKFGGARDIFRGHRMYLGALRRPLHFDGVRRLLAKNYLRHFLKLWPFLFWRLSHRAQYRAKTARFEGGFSPDRGLFPLPKSTGKPFVSVVVRTCGRPDTLRDTLASLCHQTYRNFEVVVTEDGPPAARDLVEREFSGRLDIRYLHHEPASGRAKNGNRGLAAAKGAYLCFLDDDDYFYPDHLELLAAYAAAHPASDLVTAASMALEADVASKTPYKLAVRDIYPIRFDRLDNFLLCQSCPLPIQSVLFKRRLFEELGGLNEALDGDEDWSMWLKYFAAGQRVDDTKLDIPRATSLFVVPASSEQAKQRELYYQQFEDAMLDDDSIAFRVTPRQMRGYYEGLIADLKHLRHTGGLDAFLDRDGRKQRREQD